METESEEREACLRRHRERDGARWASPTVDQTQARLEHNASYRHTHLQQLATNRQRRLESEMAEESYTRFFFSAISIFLPYIRSCNVCQPCAMDLLVWFPDPSVMRMRGRGKKGLGNNYTPTRALEFDLHVPLSGCGCEGIVISQTLLSPPAHAHN